MVTQKINLKDCFPFLCQDGQDPILEIFLPYNMTEMGREHNKRPGILVCPGGGYAMCSQREGEAVALPFVAAGYNAFVLWYSCAPHRHPTQLREVAAAIELIAAKSDEWNSDAARIAIMGFSAGGHLAAHYATCFDVPEVRAVFPESKPVAAEILAYPVITADKTEGHLGSFFNFLGTGELTPQQQERFSLQNRVTPHTPPTFLWHTAADDCVPVENSLRYALALKKNGVSFEMHIEPFGQHGLATADGLTNDLPILPAVRRNRIWTARAVSWLNMVFCWNNDSGDFLP